MGLSRQWLRAGRDDQMFQQSLKPDSNCFFWQGGRETWTLKWLMDAQFGQAFIPFRQIWGRPCHRWMWSPTQESRQTNDNHGTPIGFSPLINCHIANWKITVFNRWINYKWAMFNSYVTNYQRVSRSSAGLGRDHASLHRPNFWTTRTTKEMRPFFYKVASDHKWGSI